MVPKCLILMTINSLQSNSMQSPSNTRVQIIEIWKFSKFFKDNWPPMCFNLRFLEKMFIQIFIWFGKVYLDIAILLATRWKLDLTRWSKIRTSIFTVVTSLDCVICTVKTINVPNNTVLNGSSQTVKLLDLEHRYELKMNDGQGRSLTARHP